MELRQLEHFIAAAEELQFTRAAERVHVVQSTLSASIRALEQELGVSLFRRTTRRVELTDFGHAFAGDARRVLAAAAQALEGLKRVQGALRGRLSIGTGQYVGGLDVPELLVRFCAAYPDVEIKLRTDAAAVLANEVREGKLDVFLAASPENLPPDLIATKLGSASMVLACPSAHPLSGRQRVRLDELANETFVDFPLGWSSRTSVDRACDALHLRRRVAFEVNDIIGLLNLVSHGLGIAILPGGFSAIDADVRFLRLTKAPVMHYAAVTRSHKEMSAVSKEFLAMALTVV